MNRLRFLLIMLISLSACVSKSNTERLINIGKRIVHLDTLNAASKYISDIVIVGDGLFQKMTEVRNHATSYDFKIKRGDLNYPYGDCKADYILTIITDYQDVAIRLRYNRSKDKYDILGYMTLCR